MKALVFHKKKEVSVDNVPDPKIKDERDIILKITSTAICGSDLHIYNGLFPQPRPMVLGHEFMGVVEEVGKDVQNLQKGDRVVIPFPIACGKCFFCEHQLSTHCENSNPEHYGPNGGILIGKGAGLFGYTDLYGGYDGGQAQYARVPYADFSARKVPDEMTDEQVLFLTDIFPTGYAAIDWARMQGGETVAVFGCGPVGLMAQKIAWLKGAKRVIGIDLEDYRLEAARKYAKAETINFKKQNVAETIREMTEGRGADVCVDAAGMEADKPIPDKVANAVGLEIGTISALRMCFESVRRGGVVSVVGVYASHYHDFPWSQIFDKGLIIQAGQAPVQKYIDELLKLVVEGKIILNDIITHTLPLEQAPHGYKVFNEKKEDCVKVVLKP